MHGNEQWPISLGRQRKLALLVALGGSSRSVLSPWSQGESGLRSAGFEHRRRHCGGTVATNAADKVALWALILNFFENSLLLQKLGCQFFLKRYLLVNKTFFKINNALIILENYLILKENF